MIPSVLRGGFSCRQVAEHGSAFIDGELSTSQWLRYRLHLLTCPPCAEYVRQLGITVDALHRAPGEDGQQLRAQVLEVFEAWSAERAQGEQAHGGQAPPIEE